MKSWKLMAAIMRLGGITYTTITWVKLSIIETQIEKIYRGRMQ
ncbi:hypothetical protein [Bacillus thuringiensis]|nr:hypothetical protein [Bacillus thuringiensis]